MVVSTLRNENRMRQEKKHFVPMLPSQGAQARKVGSSLRDSNATTFRFFSKGEDQVQVPTGTNRSELASCLDETSQLIKDMSSKSITRTKDATRTVTGPTRRKEPVAPPPKTYFSHNQKDCIDGYFSSKLTKSIENLTKSTDMLKLSKSSNAPAKTNGLIFKCKCRRFKVGKAESRYPSDVRFFDNRIEYCFVRESQFGKDHIDMVMFYRDMISPKLSTQQGCFVYRIPRHLHHYFQDYEPENQLHVMKVKFERQSELTEFKTNVLPVIQDQSQDLL